MLLGLLDTSKQSTVITKPTKQNLNVKFDKCSSLKIELKSLKRHGSMSEK